jgi:adenylate cyclase
MMTNANDTGARPLILVVDDTPDNLALMAGLLRDTYRVKVANGGEKALEIVMGDPKPSLILLDIMMPGIDGHEVCRRIKADPATREIPVIFLTAKAEVEDERRGLEIGAVDYITKPVSPPVVLARVKTHLALSEQRRTLEDLSRKLAKYLSPQVYNSIFTGKRGVDLATDRKKLTVFLSDIKSFASITADLQPEDLAFLLNNYFSEMSKIAIKHGATIDKFIGDAMLMFFGDPESRGVAEDARACLRMAIEMQRRMRDLAEIWKAKGFDLPFEMRIGINTGYCNVGNFGSPDRMDYTIIGGEVNLAARLEGAADPGGILMSYETYALVKDMVAVEEREAIVMKGIKRQVRAFAVANILEGFEAARSVIHHEGDGVYLHIEAERLVDPAARGALTEKLRAALSRLEAG